MTTYEHLVDATLAHGLMPLVVPQLKTITLGGAVTGLGIESTSFRHGLPHESVREMDVLTADGEVITVTPDGEHADLFRGFPNSYGTLGYALRLRDRPAAGRARSSGWSTAGSPTAELADGDRRRCCAASREPGCRLRRRHRVRPRRAVPDARHLHRRPRPRTQRLHRPAGLLPLHARARTSTTSTVARLHLALGHRLVLVLAGPRRAAPGGAPALAAPLPPLRRLPPPRRPRPPHRAQRAGPPAGRVARRGAGHPGRRDPGASGWRSSSRPSTPTSASPRCGCARCGCGASGPGRCTRCDPASSTSTSGSGRASRSCPGGPRPTTGRVEELVADLGGHKSLYSTVHYDEAEFWQRYNGPAYRVLKERYDPRGRLPDLYTKVAG